MVDYRYVRPGITNARGRAIEECGELIAALGKAIRFGWNAVNPELPVVQQESNFLWVKREIADVRIALAALEMEMDKIIDD